MLFPFALTEIEVHDFYVNLVSKCKATDFELDQT